MRDRKVRFDACFKAIPSEVPHGLSAEDHDIALERVVSGCVQQYL